jgi:hypothetical protein
MPFLAAFEAPPRPESMKFPVFSLLSREFGIFRDEFAADSPLQRRVRHELGNRLKKGGSLLSPARPPSICYGPSLTF